MGEVILTLEAETTYTRAELEALAGEPIVWPTNDEMLTLPAGTYRLRVRDGVLNVWRIG